MLQARGRSIWMPPTSHIASLNRHTPKFSGIRLKLTWCQPFAVQGLPKSSNPESCTQKRRSWGVFFCCKESIFLVKWSIFAYSMSHIFWKISIWRLIWYIWGPSTCILWPVRFFVTLCFGTGSISWKHVYILVLWQIWKMLDFSWLALDKWSSSSKWYEEKSPIIYWSLGRKGFWKNDMEILLKFSMKGR